jgi:hypothetical protein
MFTIGPLDIEVSVTGTLFDAHGNPSVPVNHNGTTHVVKISSLLTVPVDVEICGALTANRLKFASGSTWSKPLIGIPAYVRSSPSLPTLTNEPLIRPVNAGTGNETVRCSQVRYRNTGASGWGRWQIPASNNTVTVAVP